MQAEFVAYAVKEHDFPREGIPEIVLAGRSNVGKSSLINKLAGKKGLARTSSTPGKTQSINFYRFGGAFYLVDLPGFGYAKAGKTVSRSWSRLIEQYFRVRSTIRLVIHLLDSRLEPTRLDLELEGWLSELKMPRLIIAIKADKLSGNEKAVQQRVISAAFHGEPVIMASAVTGIGCNEIWNRVVEATRGR
jgi:GTP-binding protein